MLKRTRISIAISAAFGAGFIGAVPMAAIGQVALPRAEITGTALRRVDAETALPVTIIQAEELIKQGVTTVEQAIGRVAANQAAIGISQGIGATTGGKSEADLRGLSAAGGSSKTLVLLNGRRIANHAYDASSVDLNAIPLAAIDRIEVLRDGASALYGTDAIGGVINFILRRDFTGIDVSVEHQAPQKAGGDTSRASLTAGFGSLSQQGFNVMGVVDVRKQKVVESVARDFAASGAAFGRTSGTSFPGDVNGFEPTLPGCAPPNSIPNAAGTQCRYDFVRDIDIVPKNDQLSLLLRGSFAIGKDHTAALEYLRAENNAVNKVAPAPTSMIMPASSPFYPVGAPNNEPGGINVVNWRVVPAGKRTSESEAVGERLLGELQGMVAGWDYKTGVYNSKSTVEDVFTNGYFNYSLLQAAVTAGVVNPVGAQTPAGQAAIQASKILGPVLKAKGEATTFDARISKDLTMLPAGPLAAAFGVEYREEKFTYDVQDITPQAASSGLELAVDTSGKRDVTALYTEFVFPLAPKLEATLAGRFDRYSDVGNTFNPKVALRYQPTRQLLLRGSYNTGFRAPTLYDIYQPAQLTFTSDAYNDPVLCPGGTAIPPAADGVVCNQQVLQRFGGPLGFGRSIDSLNPEKSKTLTFGFAIEPVRNASFGLDFWFIRLRDQVGGLPEQAIFGDPSKYASRILRCSQIDPALRALIDVCLNFPVYDPIAFIDAPTENLGEIKTRGIDVSFSYRTGATAYGAWGFSLDGTYVDEFRYQREKGGEFISAAGRYTDSAPVFRWQHTAQVTWSGGPWSAALGQRYKSGYTDQIPPDKVPTYQLWDASVTYTGVRNLTLTAGIKNLLDKDPPYSNQFTTFQSNYDPRFTDPLGRTYTVRAAYRF
jgi:iron complex outermembrane receptor protein